MASLLLKNLYKVYDGGIIAVSDFSLDVPDKEFVVLVGPSGCGKSTTLRMIAGLERISAGELYIDGKLVNELSPQNRDIAMVFQNYALYPHMTVYDNMAFCLKQIRMDKKAIDEKVLAAAKILGIENLLTRKPRSLSGGQKQRVALGRSIVREPKVFLLDEPLSNLDAKLRVQMRLEISKLHQKLKTTFVYVTHDQTEAMTMGTIIVVMKDGQIQQVDSPKMLYEIPSNVFVATFLGSPQMNLFNATLIKEGNKYFASLIPSKVKIELPEEKTRLLTSDCFLEKNVILGIRPEHIHVFDSTKENNCTTTIKAHVNLCETLGAETLVYASVDGKEEDVIATIHGKTRIQNGEDITLALDMSSLHLFDGESKMRIIDLPKENLIPVELNIEGEIAQIRFGKKTIDMDHEWLAKIIPSARIDSKILFAFAPQKLTLREENNALTIQGSVDFLVDYPDYSTVYLKVSGVDKPVVFIVPIGSSIKQGDLINTYLKKEDVVLRDIIRGDKIAAKYPFAENKAHVEIKHLSGSIVQVKTKTQQFEFTNLNLPSGDYILSIASDAFSGNKALIKQHKKSVLTFEGVNEETLGDKKVLYGRLSGFEGYVTALVEKDVSIFQKDKIKLYIDSSKITFEKK